jgi:hypothetical protein
MPDGRIMPSAIGITGAIVETVGRWTAITSARDRAVLASGGQRAAVNLAQHCYGLLCCPGSPTGSDLLDRENARSEPGSTIQAITNLAR